MLHYYLEELEKLAVRNRLKNNQLAGLLGVSGPYLSKMRNHKTNRPHPAFAAKLKSFLESNNALNPPKKVLASDRSIVVELPTGVVVRIPISDAPNGLLEAVDAAKKLSETLTGTAAPLDFHPPDFALNDAPRSATNGLHDKPC